jgi:hypothetical protein
MSDHFTDLHEIHHIGDMSDHTVNGENISNGVRNSFSQEYARADGIHEWAVKNPQGGEDVYHGTTLYEKTIPTGHGSHDIYDSQMHLKGTVIPNVHHGHDVWQGGSLVESSLPLGHGVSTVMNYSDPIAHLSEYSMSKLVLE